MRRTPITHLGFVFEHHTGGAPQRLGFPVCVKVTSTLHVALCENISVIVFLQRFKLPISLRNSFDDRCSSKVTKWDLQTHARNDVSMFLAMICMLLLYANSLFV